MVQVSVRAYNSAHKCKYSPILRPTNAPRPKEHACTVWPSHTRRVHAEVVETHNSLFGDPRTVLPKSLRLLNFRTTYARISGQRSSSHHSVSICQASAYIAAARLRFGGLGKGPERPGFGRYGTLQDPSPPAALAAVASAQVPRRNFASFTSLSVTEP